jgi:hypothetical protein
MSGKSLYSGMTGALKRSGPSVTDYAGDASRPRVALVESTGENAADTDRPGAAEEREPAAITGEMSQGQPALVPAPTPHTRGRAPRGANDSIAKRNNKDLTQMSVFVRKKIHKRVKIRLAQLESVDLSDVVDKLLEQWLADESA